MKILVLGGTGYIGSHAVEELARRGHEVWVFARGQTRPQLPEEVSLVRGDRHNPDDLARARTRGFDAVIDINAYTREETQRAINAFDGAVSRFVHLSTMAVCRKEGFPPVDEEDPLVTDPAAGYGYEKAECERALRWAHTKTGFPFVSVRPTGVYGPRDRKSRENYYLRRILARDPVIVPDSGAAPIFAVYIRDLVAVLANALDAEGVAGAAYNLSQPELVSVNRHIRNIAQLVGKQVDVAHVPARLLERLGFNLLQFPYYSRERLIVVDTGAARRDLGFRPTPYSRALADTIKYLLDHDPESQPSLEETLPPVMPRSRERALVDRYRREVAELEDRLTDEWLNEALPEV
ncbi:MAG TPA: NAD-dependent epimerase/dehydratase family protein [Blastocatellia bacterium]|nr:NAD-dependent epimerase/dehydratase family protein [Blastocatellia bacterium]